jgi:hypothetical protein
MSKAGLALQAGKKVSSSPAWAREGNHSFTLELIFSVSG